MHQIKMEMSFNMVAPHKKRKYHKPMPSKKRKKASLNETDNFQRFVIVMARAYGMSRKKLEKILFQGSIYANPPLSFRREHEPRRSTA